MVSLDSEASLKNARSGGVLIAMGHVLAQEWRPAVSQGAERGSVEVLIGDSRPWVFRLALAIVGRADVAEDVAQESLLKALAARKKLASADDPRAYLRRIVINCSTSAMRRRPTESLVERASCDDLVEETAVRDVLFRLSADHRIVLALVGFEGLTYSEAADALDIPEGTVASRVHAAREAFRRAWEDR